MANAAQCALTTHTDTDTDTDTQTHKHTHICVCKRAMRAEETHRFWRAAEAEDDDEEDDHDSSDDASQHETCKVPGPQKKRRKHVDRVVIGKATREPFRFDLPDLEASFTTNQ